MPVIPLFSSALPEMCRMEIRRRHPHARFLPPDPALPAPICHHPDTLLCTIPGYLFLPQTYYYANAAFFDDIARLANVTLCTLSTPHGSAYPADAAYNGVLCGRYLLGKTAILAPEIPDTAKKCGYTPISVRQGYAACSAIVLGDALFTSDPSILRAVGEFPAITATRLDAFPIALPGYDCGFPGGCCGLVGDTLYWFGTPDAQVLTPVHTHCRMHGITECVLWESPRLTDYGGIRVVQGTDAIKGR